MWFPLWLSWKIIYLQWRRPGFDSWVGKISWRRERLPTPVFWPGEFHGLFSPWDCKELGKTEQPSLSLSLCEWLVIRLRISYRAQAPWGKGLGLTHAWVWVDSRSWWWTGRSGVLRFMGSQRVGHDWATELSSKSGPKWAPSNLLSKSVIQWINEWANQRRHVTVSEKYHAKAMNPALPILVW